LLFRFYFASQECGLKQASFVQNPGAGMAPEEIKPFTKAAAPCARTAPTAGTRAAH
jgi:hypothetical protein